MGNVDQFAQGSLGCLSDLFGARRIEPSGSDLHGQVSGDVISDPVPESGAGGTLGRSDLGQREAAFQLVGEIVRSDSQDFSGGQPAKSRYHVLGPFLNPCDDRSELAGHCVNLSSSQGAVLDQGSQRVADHLFKALRGRRQTDRRPVPPGSTGYMPPFLRRSRRGW